MPLRLSLLVLTLFALAACGGGPRHTAASAVEAFKAAGLEADSRPLTRDDYGMAPYLCADNSLRVLIPSLGEDQGGRLFECGGADDAAKLKTYSYVYTRDNLILQLSNKLTEEQAKAYEAALKSVP